MLLLLRRKLCRSDGSSSNLLRAGCRCLLRLLGQRQCLDALLDELRPVHFQRRHCHPRHLQLVFQLLLCIQCLRLQEEPVVTSQEVDWSVSTEERRRNPTNAVRNKRSREVSTNCAEKEEEKEEEKHSQCGGSIVSLREESVFLHLSPHSNGRDKRSASTNRSIARLLFQRCVAHQGLRSLSSVPPT